MEILNVSESDIKDFIRIYQKAYEGLEEYAYTASRSIKSYFRWLLKRDRNGFYKAVEDGKPVGFIACDTSWISPVEGVSVGEIHEIVVLPEFRERGIGRKLVEKCIEYSKRKGREICELWVGKRNEKAKRFYRDLGFQEAEEWGKWVRMSKKI